MIVVILLHIGTIPNILSVLIIQAPKMEGGAQLNCTVVCCCTSPKMLDRNNQQTSLRRSNTDGAHSHVYYRGLGVFSSFFDSWSWSGAFTTTIVSAASEGKSLNHGRNLLLVCDGDLA